MGGSRQPCIHVPRLHNWRGKTRDRSAKKKSRRGMAPKRLGEGRRVKGEVPARPSAHFLLSPAAWACRFWLDSRACGRRRDCRQALPRRGGPEARREPQRALPTGRGTGPPHGGRTRGFAIPGRHARAGPEANRLAQLPRPCDGSIGAWGKQLGRPNTLGQSFTRPQQSDKGADRPLHSVGGMGEFHETVR